MRPEPVHQRPSVQERHHNQRNGEVAAVRPQVGRKRLVPPSSIPKASVPRRRRGPGRRGRSNTETDSEAESPDVERRSIHNDMERLRRIGLKNLFDELKKQIPATRDRERAPKVKILQEAAALCRKLREEELERERLKKQQTKLATKLKKLRLSLSSRYRAQRSFWAWCMRHLWTLRLRPGLLSVTLWTGNFLLSKAMYSYVRICTL